MMEKELKGADLLAPDKIKGLLKTKKTAGNIIYLDKVDSTNTYAKALAKEGGAEGTLIIAEEQTGGKGRMGRKWSSPPKGGIWMSLILRPGTKPLNAPGLTIVTGISIARALSNVTKADIALKWPNDVIYGSKKLCGILTEMECSGDLVEYVIVGMGINANIREFPEELSKKAVSLSSITGSSVDRNTVVAEIMNEFEKNYELFLKTSSLRFLCDEYNSLLTGIGKTVIAKSGREEVKGISRGIDETGALLVEPFEDNGHEIVRIDSGEVTLRGDSGYV